MRRAGWFFLLAGALPAAADTQFRVKPHEDLSMGTEECNIRVAVKGAAQVTVKGDTVTISGTGGKNNGSVCTARLPDGEVKGFRFEGQGVELAESPTDANSHQAVVRIPDEGRYEFRLSWETAPAGFSRNNAVKFKTRGRGEVRVGEVRLGLESIDVTMDLGGKVMISFHTDDKRPLSFSGVVNQRRKEQWRADVVCEGPEWHVQGPMFLTVNQAKDRIMAAKLEATDGHDRMSLTWSSAKHPSAKK